MTFILFALLLLPTPSYAGPPRHLLYFGGGGEPITSDTTIFDGGLSAMGTYLKSNHWDSEIRFDGGHSVTDSILNNQFSKSKSRGPFTVESFTSMIENYKNKIISGEIKPGEELLIMIDSHGAELEEGETNHKIAVGSSTTPLDKNSLKNSTTMNLDLLQSLANLAKEHHVKLGIVDMSCHSGNSLKLANDSTCVITSSGPNHYGQNIFSKSLISHFKSGETLESAFLKTRESFDQPSFPMISTPTGQKLNQQMYSEFTPFLYSKAEDGDKLSPYLLAQGQSCQTQESPVTALTKLLDPLKNSHLIDLIHQYGNQQKKVTDTVKTWALSILKENDPFQCGMKYENDATPSTWDNIFRIMEPAKVKNLEAQKVRLGTNPENERDRVRLQAEIECWKQTFSKGEEIQAAHPELGRTNEYRYIAKYKELMNEFKGSRELANQIGIEENKIYEAYYESLSKDDPTNNPCKDFKL